MATGPEIQYVSDDQGNAIAVKVPIEVWREIKSERETACFLKSDAMRQRLLEAKNRIKGTSLAQVRAQLGI
jgi:hypothetical protein